MLHAQQQIRFYYYFHHVVMESAITPFSTNEESMKEYSLPYALAPFDLCMYYIRRRSRTQMVQAIQDREYHMHEYKMLPLLLQRKMLDV